MNANILDTLHHNIIDYLEGVSDPEKSRLPKRWDKDKDHETHGLSTPDHTALYERFNPRFHALDPKEPDINRIHAVFHQ
jgi:hypothetical protein